MPSKKETAFPWKTPPSAGPACPFPWSGAGDPGKHRPFSTLGLKKTSEHRHGCPLEGSHDGIEHPLVACSLNGQYISHITHSIVLLKSLQCFLGFANFCQCFIRNFSTNATSLTDLTSSKRCSPGMRRLRGPSPSSSPSSEPILVYPDPKAQFIVEERCSLSAPPGTQRYTPVPSCLINRQQQSKTMTSVTASCWQSRWPWRSGTTG